jgi:hypothetical protein
MKAFEKQKLVPIMIRFQPPEAENLRDLAHDARMPLAVYVRELVLGRVPSSAPPPLDELSYEETELLHIIQGLVSNLSQINTHAANLGEPICRLSGEGGLLIKLQQSARSVGLTLKAGVAMPHEVIDLLQRLREPSDNLNACLARPLNEGQGQPASVWHDVLQPLQSALFQVSFAKGDQHEE